MVRINDKAPEFTVKAFQNGDVRDISLSDYKGKWVVLFFYPADFTYICPTELGSLADSYDMIKALGAEVLSVSTDTEFSHKAWYDSSDTIKRVKFPMLADPTGKVCKKYGTYIREEGLSLRGTFIIDPDGVVKALEIHSNDVGRNIGEMIRKIRAAMHVRDNPGEACPANWNGGEILKPHLDLVGKI